MKNTDESIFGAIRGLTHEVSRKLYFAHNQAIIFGYDLAEEGVAEECDLFMREYESRLNVFVMVARKKASDILYEETDLERLPAEHIESLLETRYATSQLVRMTLREFTTAIVSKTTCPVAPIIELYALDGRQKARISGGAVFKDANWSASLTKPRTAGFYGCWARSKAASCTWTRPGAGRSSRSSMPAPR
jgi:spore germination protein KC